MYVQAAEMAGKMAFFCPWWPWHLTLTFKLVCARDQTCPPCEFGENMFSSSRDISYTNKEPQTDGAKNRTFCSSLRVVITLHQSQALLTLTITNFHCKLHVQRILITWCMTYRLMPICLFQAGLCQNGWTNHQTIKAAKSSFLTPKIWLNFKWAPQQQHQIHVQ